MSKAKDLSNVPTNPSGFRNIIINSGMDIAQRGTSLTRGGTTDYGLDRWFASGFGSGQNFTVSRSSATPPTGFQYFQRIATTTTTSTNMFVSQSLETSSVIPLQGRTATFSFRYRVPVNFTGTWTARVVWSTATDTNLTPSTSRTVVASKSLTNTTSWATDSLTFTVPATATALAVEFVLVNNVVNGAQFDFTGVQLELGSIATPFERRPIGAEISLCQRYFCKSFPIDVAPANNLGTGPPGGGNQLTIFNTTVGNSYSNFQRFPVPMRRAPDMVAFNSENANAGSWSIYNSAGALNSSYATTAAFSPHHTGFLVAYGGLTTVTVANGAWTASAEL